jgi:hypothetical protein
LITRNADVGAEYLVAVNTAAAAGQPLAAYTDYTIVAWH